MNVFTNRLYQYALVNYFQFIILDHHKNPRPETYLVISNVDSNYLPLGHR